MDMCFEIYELMRSRGLTPSQVTYGILLDGFINDNEVELISMYISQVYKLIIIYKPHIAEFLQGGEGGGDLPHDAHRGLPDEHCTWALESLED